MVFSFLVLIILLFLFTTIIREKHREELESSIVEMDKQGRELERFIGREYNLTVDQAIGEVEKIKGALIKFIYYLSSEISE